MWCLQCECLKCICPFLTSVQMAGNAIITHRWNYRQCKQSSLFGHRVLLSFCCCCWIMCFGKPLTKVFVWLPTSVAVITRFCCGWDGESGLIPGNLGQGSENKWLEKRLQHPATQRFHTYEMILLVLWANKSLSGKTLPPYWLIR